LPENCWFFEGFEKKRKKKPKPKVLLFSKFAEN
jgi:hypothetical protein